jgi:hypothetical protein
VFGLSHRSHDERSSSFGLQRGQFLCAKADQFAVMQSKKLTGRREEIRQVEIRRRQSSGIDRASVLLSRNAVIESYSTWGRRSRASSTAG